MKTWLASAFRDCSAYRRNRHVETADRHPRAGMMILHVPKFYTYRGGDLPNTPHIREFFAPAKAGTKFRTKQFVSTSSDLSTAKQYMRAAASEQTETSDSKEPTLWTYRFEVSAGRAACLHVNFIDHNMTDLTVDNEAEYLLTPYSVLEIVSVAMSPRATAANPHKIVLKVHNDNKYKRATTEWEDLPLAPWV